MIFSRSSLIYDARNNQKKIEFPEITEVSNFSCQESELSVLWKDGHTSTYNLLDLENNFKQKDASSNIKGHCFSDISVHEKQRAGWKNGKNKQRAARLLEI